MRVRERSEASVIRYQLLVLGYRKTALAGLHDSGQRDDGKSREQGAGSKEQGARSKEQGARSEAPEGKGRRARSMGPLKVRGERFAVKNVFTSSPSPQTVTAGKRLNHFPFGTSGSVSSQSKQTELARRDFAGSDAIKQVVQQSRRKTSPPILGIGTAAVESTNNRFAKLRGLHGICRVDHALGQTR